jgi:hypothetical protein
VNGLERKLNPRNILDRTRRQRRDLEIVKRREIIASSLEEISNDLGDQIAGRFLALISGTEPTDADASGAFMSALGEEFPEGKAHIGGVNNGELQFGLSAEDGSGMFGAGKVKLTALGVLLQAMEATGPMSLGQSELNPQIIQWIRITDALVKARMWGTYNGDIEQEPETGLHLAGYDSGAGHGRSMVALDAHFVDDATPTVNLSAFLDVRRSVASDSDGDYGVVAMGVRGQGGYGSILDKFRFYVYGDKAGKAFTIDGAGTEVQFGGSPWLSMRRFVAVQATAATYAAVGVTSPTTSGTLSYANPGWVNHAIAATTGTIGGLISTTFNLTIVQQRPHIRFKFKTGSVITNLRIWAGFVSAAPGNSDSPAISLAAFRFSSGVSANRFYACVKDGTTLVAQQHGFCYASNIFDCEIEYTDDLITQNWVFTVHGYGSDTVLTIPATNGPQPDTPLGFVCQAITTTASAKNFAIDKILMEMDDNQV